MFILKEGNYSDCCAISIDEKYKTIQITTNIFNLKMILEINNTIGKLQNIILNKIGTFDEMKYIKAGRLSYLLDYFSNKLVNFGELIPFVFIKESKDDIDSKRENIKLFQLKSYKFTGGNIIIYYDDFEFTNKNNNNNSISKETIDFLYNFYIFDFLEEKDVIELFDIKAMMTQILIERIENKNLKVRMCDLKEEIIDILDGFDDFED